MVIKKNQKIFSKSGVCFFPLEEIKSGGEFLVKPPEFPPEAELRLTSLTQAHLPNFTYIALNSKRL